MDYVFQIVVIKYGIRLKQMIIVEHMIHVRWMYYIHMLHMMIYLNVFKIVNRINYFILIQQMVKNNVQIANSVKILIYLTLIYRYIILINVF